MGVENNAWAAEQKLPPIEKEIIDDNAQFNITVIFSTFTRYNMIDPRDSAFEPDKVFERPHMYHVLKWGDGDFANYENSGDNPNANMQNQDKVFYVDCSGMEVPKMTCGNPSSEDMTNKLKGVISFIKDYLNLQYVKGKTGVVHFNLCGYIPVDPMAHALRKLFTNESYKEEYYKSFTSDFYNKFQNTFQRYTNSGFSFTVDQITIYEAYNMNCQEVHELHKTQEMRVYMDQLEYHNQFEPDEIVYQVEEQDKGSATLMDGTFIKEFYFQKGTRDGKKTDDKIYYHGRFYSLDELKAHCKKYSDAKAKAYHEKREKEWQDWWDHSKAEREEAEFRPYQEANTAIHREGETEKAKLATAQTSLNAQKNDPDSDEYKAYEVGRQVNEADGTLSEYHDINRIEYDSLYVDSDVLKSRQDKYKNALKEFDTYTREKEEDAISNTKWYPLKIIWIGIRIAVGIATFINPMFILVDMALEAIQLGVQLVAEKKPFQWSDLFGMGVDALCLLAMRGGALKPLFKGLSRQELIKGGGKAMEGVNEVRMADVNTKAIKAAKAEIKDSIETINKATTLKPVDAPDVQGYIKITQENLKYAKGHYKEAVEAMGKQQNQLAYAMYQQAVGENKLAISKLFQDGRVFIANWHELDGFNKFLTATGIVVRDGTMVFGDAYTLYGIGQNGLALIN